MNTGINTRRTTLNKLGPVSTRSGGGTDSMSGDISRRWSMKLDSRSAVSIGLAEDPGQAQRGQRVVGQRVVVDHVGPCRCGPRQLGQVQALLFFEHIRRFEGLLRGLDGVGGKCDERV